MAGQEKRKEATLTAEPGISADRAIEQARARLGRGDVATARASLVVRLDRADEAYYLVEFGEAGAVAGVAAVDAGTGQVMVWAELSGTRPHSTIDRHAAVRRAGFLPDATTRLVWKPSRASPSPLYPIWEIRTADRTAYVDAAGTVWSTLEHEGPGGD